MSDQPDPARKVVDLFVYAPIGLAADAREVLPKLAKRGREEVEMQVRSARAVGEFAFRMASTQLSEKLSEARERVAPPASEQSAEPAATEEAPADKEPPAAAEAPAANEPTEAAPAPGMPQATAEELSSGAADPSGLAIPDYDSLAASQVVSRLGGLTPAELESVRAYEAATRGRATVLNRIADLTARAGA